MTAPPPPEGHRTWLDYAVANMDYRAAALQYLLEDEATWSKDDIEQAVRNELAEFRLLAGS